MRTRELERIVAKAAKAETPHEAAGLLVAGWRSWFGEGGPGLNDRMMMARQIETVIGAFITRAFDESLDVFDEARWITMPRRRITCSWEITSIAKPEPDLALTDADIDALEMDTDE